MKLKKKPPLKKFRLNTVSRTVSMVINENTKDLVENNDLVMKKKIKQSERGYYG